MNKTIKSKKAKLSSFGESVTWKTRKSPENILEAIKKFSNVTIHKQKLDFYMPAKCNFAQTKAHCQGSHKLASATFMKETQRLKQHMG